MPRNGITLAELAERIDARLEGPGDVVIRRVGTLERAGADAIAFLSQPRFRPLLAGTQAGAVILTAADAPRTTRPKLVHPNPYAAYAKAAALLHAAAPARPGIDASARVAQDAVIDATASVGPYAVVESRAFVGPRAIVGSHVHIGEDATIAEDARLHPHVTIYAGTIVGARTVVHAGAVLGADGFGMAEENGRWLRIPQIGRVVVGADCEVGANTTIDRGAIDDTVIEDDVKLDNQIQVGHNVRIGAHTAIAGCVGIAGSAVIGRNVRIGGAAMIAGHLTIPDNTIIAGGTTVLSSIKSGGAYNSAFPLLPQQQWRYVAVELKHLRELAARVDELERALRAQQDDVEREGDDEI